MQEIRLTKDNFKEKIMERNRLVGDDLIDECRFEDLFKGHITAEFNFNITDVFKQHFRCIPLSLLVSDLI